MPLEGAASPSPTAPVPASPQLDAGPAPVAANPPAGGDSAEAVAAGSVAARSGQSPAAAGSAAVPGPAGDGLDPDGLRAYRFALATQARRYKHYPARARDSGWQGTAEVQVSVPASGIVPAPRLARSSGFELLDAAALDMIANAAAQTVVPTSLRGRSFTVLLPVVFDLAAD